jgi:hypothetical protein
MRIGSLLVFVGPLACGARTDLGGHVELWPVDAASSDDVTDAPIDTPVDAVVTECVAQATTTLTTVSGIIDELALDAGFVYFHTGDGVWRVPKGGGKSVLVAPKSSQGWPRTFAVDDFGITWQKIASGGATTDIYRVPKHGGAVTALATLSGQFWGCISIPNGAVYVWNDTLLDEVDAQGAVTPIGPLPTATNDMVFDGSATYLVASGGVYREQGGAFQAVANAGAYGLYLVVDATDVYFEVGDSAGNRTLARAPKTGGTPTTLLTTSNYAIAELALDASHLYVVQRTQDTVLRMNKDGTAQVTIGTAAPNEGAIGVAVDDTCVYWGSVSSGTTTYIDAVAK